MPHYFVYKNGLGNYFTPLTCGTDGTIRKQPVLYVGFDEEWPAETGETLPATEENGGETPHPWKLDDLNHIRFVSHKANQSQFLLLTFEKTVLRFWEVVKPVRVATAAELQIAEQIGGRRPKDYAPHFEDPATNPLRVLPVKLVAEVPRGSLYTSVDSLASYQYLIRGTCRPLWRASGPTAATPVEGIQEASKAPVPRCKRVGPEQPFAAFVRLYLNELLHRRGKLPASASGERLGKVVTDHEIALRVVLSTLNPILVETAALTFVQDLGLTPDIGVGKAKDVVDVRARAAAPDGSFSKEIAQAALDKLDGISVTDPGRNDAVRKNLAAGTLDIQCKAADGGEIPEGILYFGSASAGRQDRVNSLLLDRLEGLPANGGWPHLHRFLSMQARLLLAEWSAPAVHPACPGEMGLPTPPGAANAP